MGDKYKVKKADLKALFASADMLMESNYHSLYKRLGIEQGPNGNFHCWNESAHGRGTDVHASVSINDKTGVWHCFTCDLKGNFQSYFRDYLKGGEYGESYTDFIIDFLGMANSGHVHFSNEYTDPNYMKNRRELQDLYDNLQKAYKDTKGKQYMIHGELSKAIKEASTLPMELLDKCVDYLLDNPEKMAYLEATRNIKEPVIRRYRIGLDGKGRFIFPTISAEGDLVNLKAYDPTNPNQDYKWMYPYKGYETRPVPIDHFTHQKIYFFEGEPDCYCAIAFGVAGAVTLGSKSITDVNKAFGEAKAKQLFGGKEIIICFDADKDGRVGAVNLAKSVYPYCKQVKIVDFDKSDINPNGLNPDVMHEVTSHGKTKAKRVETDFTDWMRKNSFNESARRAFDVLVDKTKVYILNEDRLRRETCKVTLQEARMSRYFSANSNITLDLVASVSDFNCDAFMYPSEFTVACHCMNDEEKMAGRCKNCMVPSMPGFGSIEELEFHFLRGEIPREHINNPLYIQVNDHNLLGLIEVTDIQKVKHQKNLSGINETCRFAVITDMKNEKLLHVRLAKDVNEFSEESDTSDVGNSDIDMEAYMMGDMDIYPNRSYRFEASQTTAWNGQHAVLFVSKAEPIATSIEAFQMDSETHDLLRIFQPKEEESIKEHLDRRYNVFGNASGITGRRDVFMINDFVFFSPVEIHNKKLLPQVTRGWVEALIAGDPRCGKTLISKFLHNHYKAGELVSGSSAVSRTGLLGGITYFKNRANIAWGKIPMNDGGLLIIDELSNVHPETLSDLTSCRSDGVAEIGKIKSGRAPARTRKIMLSNQRVWKSEDKKEYNYGIEMHRDLCVKDEILARFDIGYFLKEGDVNVEDFSASYDQISTEFTEYQCQHLIMWAWSRNPEDVVFEDGVETHINDAQMRMLTKFHPSTQLVNREMRAKLVRLSISLATMLYSTVPNDWNKIFVRKEHVDFVVDFLDQIYCHPNMKMDAYSDKKRRAETLGNMEFMQAILKYIDINALLQEEEYTERAICQIFYDYLDKVNQHQLYMVDASSDKIMSTNQKPHEGAQKLIGTLTGRNCLARTRRGTYKKTAMFNAWLTKRLEMGDGAPFSDMLELVANEQAAEIMEKVQKSSGSTRAA